MSEFAIKTCDKLGIEVHFIRLVYYTIFDVDMHSSTLNALAVLRDYNKLIPLMLDLIFLIAIAFPLFVMSLRYLTSTASEPYLCKWNSLVAPAAVIPMFFSTNLDILILCGLTGVMNAWVAWK